MQTGKTIDLRKFQSETHASEFEFMLADGAEVAVEAEFFSENPFTVFIRGQHSWGGVDIPIFVGVTHAKISQKYKNASAIMVHKTGKAQFVHFVQSKAVGIAPMDTTPMEISSQLPAPTMEELIRREFSKRFPPKRDLQAEATFDAEDEVLARAGGSDYSVDDDDPDDPLEVTPADVNSARQRKRAASNRRVHKVDDGSDSVEGSDRGGPGEAPKSPAGEPKA